MSDLSAKVEALIREWWERNGLLPRLRDWPPDERPVTDELADAVLSLLEDQVREEREWMFARFVDEAAYLGIADSCVDAIVKAIRSRGEGR